MSTDEQPSWLKKLNRWADSLEAKYMTPWLGPPKDWHSWIYHTGFAVLGSLIGALLGLIFLTASLGYVLGAAVMAAGYTIREALGADKLGNLDSRADVVGPILNLIAAFCLYFIA